MPVMVLRDRMSTNLVFVRIYAGSVTGYHTARAYIGGNSMTRVNAFLITPFQTLISFRYFSKSSSMNKFHYQSRDPIAVSFWPEKEFLGRPS